MGDWYSRGQVRDSIVNQQIFEERTSSIMIAITFVACFSVFGIINLIGGSVLTFMAHNRSEAEMEAMKLYHDVANDSSVKLNYAIDPMKIIGITILVAGTFLIVMGVSLGIIAYRSVGKHRRRQERRLTSCSGQTTDSFINRSSRHSVCSTSFTGSQSRSNEKKGVEKTVSPIIESNGEEETVSSERRSEEIDRDDGSSTFINDNSPSKSSLTVPNSPKEDKDNAMLGDPENQY
ncbi:uncharacterized protein LOC129960932 [Argiope bruennichi]|uniref:Uncharacterized protein n=1 Tax=Argiope bruennichi TaxID=94029 RepID=A0A8T0FSB4_ARGBR|nr:uncharacterized protein LOC129960932 [Argiope bruennichi]KAF8794047.1 hypothetical protein HNY73_002070 [Argiope bruennichi]